MRSLTFILIGRTTAPSRLILGLMLLMISVSVSAQQKTISGIVKNAKDGSPVVKATVQVKGTSRGTTTNDKGEFTISANEKENLQVSAVGFLSTENKVGAAMEYNFELTEDAREMEAVVVTALGISRQQKALGYAAQQINSNELNDAKSNNWSSALSGKVAGLSLISPGSGPINSTRITLRGDGTLDALGNAAFIVVDGVPMSSGATSSGVGNAYQAGSGNDVPVDFGNGIQDINPDDIESISILKGPGATALYGSRAAGGAILITTKAGAAKKDKGIGITVNSNYSINTILKWPDYQHEYGQGTGTARNAAGEFYYSYGATADGTSTSGTSSAFGPRFNGQMYYQYDPAKEGRGDERTLWRPYENNIKDFWRTGSTITNNIALEGGNANGGLRASVTHTKNNWIMPNTGFERIVAQIGANYKISDKLKINTKVSYTNKKSDNLPATGYNNQSISYFMIFQNPNVDLNWYRPIWKKDQQYKVQIHPFSSFIDNPFLIAHEMTNAMNSNAMVGTLSFNYEFSKKLELMTRAGINLNNESREMRRPFNTANFLNGYYKQQSISFLETNIDFLLSYNEKIGKDIDVKVSAGANAMSTNYRNYNAYVDGLAVPNVYKLNNGLASPSLLVRDINSKVNSVYALAAFSYKNKYFIDFTGRNDWWSTLPLETNSLFYPSVNTSLILSDIFGLPNYISFAKWRASVAQAGYGASTPYLTKKYYEESEFSGSATAPTILFNDKLKPQKQTSFETGLELRFLKTVSKLMGLTI